MASQAYQVLTADQKAKFTQFIAKRQQRMQQRMQEHQQNQAGQAPNE
jgi:Spy/CpxP family protein refolding chaperone